MIQIRPVSDLRNKLPEIETLVNSGNPVYLTKNGYGCLLYTSTAWCKEEKESAYVHRTLWMYDAGTDCCREDQEELSVC